jgi:hypothetical protein
MCCAVGGAGGFSGEGGDDDFATELRRRALG